MAVLLTQAGAERRLSQDRQSGKITRAQFLRGVGHLSKWFIRKGKTEIDYSIVVPPGVSPQPRPPAPADHKVGPVSATPMKAATSSYQGTIRRRSPVSATSASGGDVEQLQRRRKMLLDRLQVIKGRRAALAGGV